MATHNINGIIMDVRKKGDFANAKKHLIRLLNVSDDDAILHKYGAIGVAKLSAATPVDTGATAASWRYAIASTPNGKALQFHNDNTNKGVPIVIYIRYGHGTSNGMYVPGNDFITPVMKEIITDIQNEIRKEVAAT